MTRTSAKVLDTRRRRSNLFPTGRDRFDLQELKSRIEKSALPKVPEYLSTKILNQMKRGSRHSESHIEVLWDELKEERNTLVAIVLENFWPQFAKAVLARNKQYIDEFNPSECEHLVSTSLSPLFESMLTAYIGREKQRDVRGQRNSMKQVFARLEAITQFGYKFNRWQGTTGALQHFIVRGLNTGKDLIGSLFTMGIIQMLEHKIPCTKINLEKFVRANMRNITIPASMNIAHGASFPNVYGVEARFARVPYTECSHQPPFVQDSYRTALENFTFNPKTFELRPIDGFYENADRAVAVVGGNILSDPISNSLRRGRTTGCPARYVRFLFSSLCDLYVQSTAQILAKDYSPAAPQDRTMKKVTAVWSLYSGM